MFSSRDTVAVTAPAAYAARPQEVSGNASSPPLPHLSPPVSSAHSPSAAITDPSQPLYALTIPSSPQGVKALPMLSGTAPFPNPAIAALGAVRCGDERSVHSRGGSKGAALRQRVRDNADQLAASQRAATTHGGFSHAAAAITTPPSARYAASNGTTQVSATYPPPAHTTSSDAHTDSAAGLAAPLSLSPLCTTVLLRHSYQGTTRILYADGRVETITPADAAAAATRGAAASNGANQTAKARVAAYKAASKASSRLSQRSGKLPESCRRQLPPAGTADGVRVILPNTTAPPAAYPPSTRQSAVPGVAGRLVVLPSFEAVAQVYQNYEPLNKKDRQREATEARDVGDAGKTAQPATAEPEAQNTSAAWSANTSTSMLFQETWIPAKAANEGTHVFSTEDCMPAASSTNAASSLTASASTSTHSTGRKKTAGGKRAAPVAVHFQSPLRRPQQQGQQGDSQPSTQASAVSAPPTALRLAQLGPLAADDEDGVGGDAEAPMTGGGVEKSGRVRGQPLEADDGDGCDNSIDGATAVFLTSVPAGVLAIRPEPVVGFEEDALGPGPEEMPHVELLQMIRAVQGDIRRAMASEQRSRVAAFASRFERPLQDSPSLFSVFFPFRPLEDIQRESAELSAASARQAEEGMRGSAASGASAAGGVATGGVPDVFLASAQTTAPMGWQVPELIRDRLLPRETPALQHRFREMLALRGILDAPDTMTCRFCVAFIWFVLLRCRKASREQSLADGYGRLSKVFADTFPLSAKETVPALDVLGQLLVELFTCLRYDEAQTDDGDGDGENAAGSAAMGEDGESRRRLRAAEAVPLLAAPTSGTQAASAAAGGGGARFACLTELLQHKEFFPLLTGEWSHLLHPAHTTPVAAASFGASASSFDHHHQQQQQRRQPPHPQSSLFTNSPEVSRSGAISVLPSPKALQTLCAVYHELWLLHGKYVEICLYEAELYKQLSILFRNVCVQVNNATSGAATAPTAATTKGGGAKKLSRRANANSVLSVSGEAADDSAQLPSHISVDMSVLMSLGTFAAVSGASPGAKDTVLDSLLVAVAHATYFTCVFCFPNDVHAGTFNDDFRTDVTQWLSYCCHGVVTTHVQTKHWPVPSQVDHDAAVRLRSAAHERELAALGLQRSRMRDLLQLDGYADSDNEGSGTSTQSEGTRRPPGDGSRRDDTAEGGSSAISRRGSRAGRKMSSTAEMGSEWDPQNMSAAMTVASQATPSSSVGRRSVVGAATVAGGGGGEGSARRGSVASFRRMPSYRVSGAAPKGVSDEPFDLENVVANAEFRLAHELDRYSRAAAQHVSELERRMARLQRRHQLRIPQSGAAGAGGGGGGDVSGAGAMAQQRRRRGSQLVASFRRPNSGSNRPSNNGVAGEDAPGGYEDDLLGVSVRSLASVASRRGSLLTTATLPGAAATLPRRSSTFRQRDGTSLMKDASSSGKRQHNHHHHNSSSEDVAPSFPILESSSSVLPSLAAVVDTSAYNNTFSMATGEGGSGGVTRKYASHPHSIPPHATGPAHMPGPAHSSGTASPNNNNTAAVSWRGAGDAQPASQLKTQSSFVRHSGVGGKGNANQRGGNGVAASSTGGASSQAVSAASARTDPRDLFRTSAFVENSKSLVTLAAELNSNAETSGLARGADHGARTRQDLSPRLQRSMSDDSRGGGGCVLSSPDAGVLNSPRDSQGRGGDGESVAPSRFGDVSASGAAQRDAATTAASLLSSYPLCTCPQSVTEYWLSMALRASSWYIASTPSSVRSACTTFYTSAAAAALDGDDDVDTSAGVDGSNEGSQRKAEGGMDGVEGTRAAKGTPEDSKRPRLVLLAQEPWRGIYGRVVAVPPISAAAQRAAKLIDTLAESLPYQQSLVYRELRLQEANQEASMLRSAKGLSNLCSSNMNLNTSDSMQPLWTGLMDSAAASTTTATAVVMPGQLASAGLASGLAASAATAAAELLTGLVTPPNLGTATIAVISPFTSGLGSSLGASQSAMGQSVASYLRRRGIGETYQGCTSPFFQLYASTCLALTLSTAEMSQLRESLNVARDKRREEALLGASMRADGTGARNTTATTTPSMLSASVRLPAQQQQELHGQQVLSSLLPVSLPGQANALLAGSAPNGAGGLPPQAPAPQPATQQEQGLKNTKRTHGAAPVLASEQRSRSPRRAGRARGRAQAVAPSAFAITVIPREEARLRPRRMRPLQDEALRRRTQLLADMETIGKRDEVGRHAYVMQQLRVANAMAQATSDAMLRSYRVKGRLAMERLAVDEGDVKRKPGDIAE